MKKIKIANIINTILIVVVFIVDFILGIFFNFDVRFYISTSLLLALSGLICLVFIAIKEALVLMYDSKRFQPIFFSTLVLSGIVAYYLVRYVKGYDKFIVLYWIVLILINVISAIIVNVLEKKSANKQNNQNKNTPRFMIRK